MRRTVFAVTALAVTCAIFRPASAATIKVEPAGDGRSKVEWLAAFSRGDPTGNPPAELNDESSEMAVGASIHASLANLKAKLEKGNP